MSRSPKEEDYFEQLSRVLPWHRSFTTYERILVVCVAVTFISMVGCSLLCILSSRSPLRRRYGTKKKLDKEQRILIATASKDDTIVLSPPPPPYYASIVKADSAASFNKKYLNSDRKSSSYEAASYLEGVQSNESSDHTSTLNGRAHRSQSARSSFSSDGTHSTSTNTCLFPSFAQVNVALNIDIIKNRLVIHLTNATHISRHPTFDKQAEFFIHVQLIDNKILKKLHDAWRNGRSSLQINAWRNLQEKTTKKLSRLPNDTLTCDEYLQFLFNKDTIAMSSLRFLLFCIDRTGIQHLMSETVIRLNPTTMSDNYQQIIEFKDPPQVTLAELLLGISYLPTAERFTIKLNKLRYFCKIGKDQKIGMYPANVTPFLFNLAKKNFALKINGFLLLQDAQLTATFFHHGRRFSQKKFPSILYDGSMITHHSVCNIEDTITLNIPPTHLQSVYVHFELILHISDSTDQSIISGGSFVLGEHTQYESEWHKILEQPRQVHLGWYQFFG